MKNLCKKCLVRAMCQKPCSVIGEYVKKTLRRYDAAPSHIENVCKYTKYSAIRKNIRVTITCTRSRRDPIGPILRYEFVVVIENGSITGVSYG